MRKLFICTCALFLFAAGFYSCDSSLKPENSLQEFPVISDFVVSPNNILFSPITDGVKDTTILISIESLVENSDVDNPPSIKIVDQYSGSTYLEGNLDLISDYRYGLELEFPTKTTFFDRFLVTATIFDENGNGNYAQSTINITGFSVFPPEIIEVKNPITVSKPSSGTDLYPFTAKVMDQEGNDSIEGVFVRVIHPDNGEVSSSPFQLFDDGSQGDDAIANDSIFTVTFPVNSGSNAVTFHLEYYAIDKGGLVSDTIKTTFSIIE